jgi:protein-S-isoprenylcysteine O-methyltransferase Ste14
MIQLAGSLIGLCWGLFLVVILLAAITAKRRVEIDRRWRWSWLALAAVAALLLRFRPDLAGPSLWPRDLPVAAAADLLVLAGLAVALWGRASIGRNWDIDPALKADHELIERGPYAYVRHPMYSGLVLMLLGTALWLGSPAALVGVVACCLGTWLKLRREEILLARHFGARYEAYRARVKALIPLVL